MADQIDPQQIDNLNEAINNLTAALGGTTSKTSSLSSSFGDLSKGQLGTLKALEKLGSGAADLTGKLYKGTKGSAQFGEAVEDAAGAIGILLLVLAPFSLAAKAVTVGLGLLAKGITVAAKQGDALYKSYQELSKVGATTAEGIQGVFKNMQNFGYGIEDLDKMVQLVSENSETLAKFSTTAGNGAKAFGEAMQDIVRDPALKELGKTPEQLNSAGAAFIRQQVAMGRTQKDVGTQQADLTKRYVIDLDRLQKLTGTSADALQKQQEALLSEDAYNVYMEMLESQGDAGQAQIQKIKEVTARLPDSYKQLVAQSIGGNIEAQQKLLFVAPNLIKDLQDPVKSTTDTLKTFNTDATQFKSSFKSGYLVAADSFRGIGGSIKDLNEAIVSTSDVDARNAAADKNIAVTDKATKNLSAIDLANMNSRDALQSFVQLGVEPATNKLRELANIASGVSGTLPGAGKGGSRGVGASLDAYQSTAGGKAAGSSKNAEEALKFFQSAGWTKEQAAGIVGNLQAESGKDLNTQAVGDGGKARGIAQWHPDRQAKFKEVTGMDLAQSTLQDQLKFVDWELKNTEKSAGDKLKQAKTAAEAAQLIDKSYERSSGAHTGIRMLNAETLLKGGVGTTSADAATATNKTASSVPSGPTMSYQDKMATLNPSTALVKSDATASAPSPAPEHSAMNTSLLSLISDKLDLLNRTNEHQLTVQKKTLQVAQ